METKVGNALPRLWRGRKGRSAFDPDLVRILKSKAKTRWRQRIFLRDGGRCLACGATSSLELAHVTPTRDFLDEGSDASIAVQASYRNDNLLTLCRACHVCYDSGELQSDPDPRLEKPRAELHAATSDPVAVRLRLVEKEAHDLRSELSDKLVSGGANGWLLEKSPYSPSEKKHLAQLVRALEEEARRLLDTPEAKRLRKAENDWRKIHKIVSLRRRIRVERLVAVLEAKRGWREPSGLRRLLAMVPADV